MGLGDRQYIAEMVDLERKRQIAKWGERQEHSTELWMTILGEEFGELCKAYLDNRYGKEGASHHEIIMEAVQCMAVLSAFLEETYALR